MQEYRAYVVGHDGHFTARIDLVCADDDSARERAKQLVDGQAVELWQGNRKIDRFDPPSH
ncbi:hypothetical protein [Bradyrhizobium sp. 195]|uniref:hypothetical protein n=1 Tax=Bradyrhizobium sp. 195 TaxID=2782662 RepID=UPI0020019BBC|nr:hypothetical protein [Bradyrhizobium sp. 195]UPK28401.1 hypothetical protein IVB26_08290 [Bradyrhizobium sp. 195]